MQTLVAPWSVCLACSIVIHYLVTLNIFLCLVISFVKQIAVSKKKKNLLLEPKEKMEGFFM